MDNRRTHIVVPAKLLQAIDGFVGKRGRSAFFADLAEREIRRLKIKKFLQQHPGPWWNPKEHPELKNGAAAWVRKMRREDEQIRSKKLRRS